ncbi:MAG: RNA polymerase sigma factor [Saprospiraceae bacterium]|nr:RNA polymerase sigma factor [Saprospiraceae bacterium]MBK7787478.1 RNA polymerase sigma factor [Saprospiraceae bacterium]MBK8109710.1 RNA polymerase sigma factor [Saprospiraceae bacterium]MBK8849220.1 RNA polymerase sigma factor [Saprospiraceae bacterium]MBK9688864.1 RNA polymerase sigma factor [Saprospiraceae bacterium]
MNIAIDLLHSEEDFIQACIAKEGWALKKLYEFHYPVMYPVCRRYANTEEDALDILHDGFIKVFRHIDKYQSGTSLVSWIKRVMINTAIDFYRRESRRRAVDIDDAKNLASGEADALSNISADEIIDLLQHLSPAYRSVFNLYVIEGYSHKELADILQITESTSRSNLVKARTKLKELLAKRFQFGSFTPSSHKNDLDEA